MQKLAIVSSHPIQYYAPWFRSMTNALQLRVFYLWDFGVTEQVDLGFQQALRWDIPLLSGYDYEFVPNVSGDRGTHHRGGLQNPTLVAQVRRYRPDAVLLMNYNYASLYRFLATWHHTPLLFRGDSHRLVSSVGVGAWARQQLIAQIYRRFAACLYVGKANYDYFRYHRVPADRLFFSPHAVDGDRFSPSAELTAQAMAWRQQLGIPADHAVIVFAGKLEPKKRPLDLLQAFQQAQLSRVSLLLVGAGSLEADLRAQASPHVYFAPFQNQSLMPRTYAAADLVVLPSGGNGETWGLAISEAMSLARPVIVSDQVGCAQDLVHPQQNGLIFAAGDRAALADCLKQALGDRQRLQQWGQASRRIVARYSYEQATQGLKDALAIVTARDRAGSLTRP